MRIFFILKIIFLGIVILNNNVSAQEFNLSNSYQCTKHFKHFEDVNNIPRNLLHAVSLTESGVYHKESKKIIPWPWTINVKGKGYYYDSKKEAILEARRLIKNGNKSIDVGCMQINLYYHPNAFADIEKAFDPQHNIAYAANFLKENFKKHTNWKNAVAAYHSETKSLGHPYAHKVIDYWHKIAKDPETEIMQASYQHKSHKNYRTSMRGKNYYNKKITNYPARYDKYSPTRRKSTIMVKSRGISHYPRFITKRNNMPSEFNIVENNVKKSKVIID